MTRKQMPSLAAGRPARINWALCSHHRPPVGHAAMAFPLP